MYIVFDEQGKEFLRTGSIENLKGANYKEVKSIPTKDGFIERARLEGDEIVWDYEEQGNEQLLKKQVSTLGDTVDMLMQMTMGGM